MGMGDGAWGMEEDLLQVLIGVTLSLSSQCPTPTAQYLVSCLLIYNIPQGLTVLVALKIVDK